MTKPNSKTNKKATTKTGNKNLIEPIPYTPPVHLIFYNMN